MLANGWILWAEFIPGSKGIKVLFDETEMKQALNLSRHPTPAKKKNTFARDLCVVRGVAFPRVLSSSATLFLPPTSGSLILVAMINRG